MMKASILLLGALSSSLAAAPAPKCPPSQEISLSDKHCPRSEHQTQQALDECYMQIALDFAMDVLARHPIEGPFGAVLVNHETNAMLCMGCNRGDINPMRHGETDLLENCTDLYPSPSGDNTRDPCMDYRKYTLYTTGEPCPMCATAIAYYKIGRLVSATPEARLACIGLPAPRFNSSFINAQFQPAYPGASETKGILAAKTDKEFAKFWNYTLPPEWPASCPEWPDICPPANGCALHQQHQATGDSGAACGCTAHSHAHVHDAHEHLIKIY